MAFQNGPRLVTIKKRPSKIVVFGLAPAETLAELGLSGLVVGRSDEDSAAEPLPEYAEALAAIPVWSPERLPVEEAADDGPDLAYGRLGPDSPEEGLGYLPAYASLAVTKSGFYLEIHDLAAIFGVP